MEVHWLIPSVRRLTPTLTLTLIGGALADIFSEENAEWERKYNLLEKTLNSEIEQKHKDCEDLREELKAR